MLKAICISSANDAAVAVARIIGGQRAGICGAHGTRAKELGMQSTTFRNACGLDEDGHLSHRARCRHHEPGNAAEPPGSENYCTVWMDTLRGGATQLVNTNKLLKSYNGITGLKTGTTGKAGVCISASASRDDLRLIAVVLGSSAAKSALPLPPNLLDYGFAMFESALVPLTSRQTPPKHCPCRRVKSPRWNYVTPRRSAAWP